MQASLLFKDHKRVLLKCSEDEFAGLPQVGSRIVVDRMEWLITASKFDEYNNMYKFCCKRSGPLSDEGVLQTVIDREGHDRQLTKVVEELAELQKELCKVILYGKEEKRVDNVAEEVADVRIMLQQVEMILGCKKEVETWESYKLERLRRRYESN